MMALGGISFGVGLAIFGFQSESIQERMLLLENSWRLLLEHPVFGIGPSKFALFPVEGTELSGSPHLTLLGIGVEAGLLGLSFYLGFMIILITQTMRLLRATQEESHPKHWVVRALAATLICYWVFGMFGFNFANSESLSFHALHWTVLSQMAHNLKGASQSPVDAT